MMDAIVKPIAGEGLELRRVPVPTPGPGEVLIKIHKTAICGSDVHIYKWNSWAQAHVKISTNSTLAAKKSNWIDFNAGVLVEDKPMKVVEKEFFDYVVAVASGEKVCSEKAGFHDFAIFKQGVTL